MNPTAIPPGTPLEAAVATPNAGGGKPSGAPSVAASVAPFLAPVTVATALGRIRIVLVETSHPGNVGATARAIKAMGLSRLALVSPRTADLTSHFDARALAAGADDVLAACTLHATLTEALEGCSWAVALTARGRAFAPVELDPEATARQVASLTFEHGADVALVFGSERAGLSNEHVMACQAVCSIDTDPEFSSLNLSQAVQILAYLCRRTMLGLAAGDSAPNTAPAKPAAAAPGADDTEPLAGVTEREQMFAHLEEALIAIEFIDPANPKRLMERLRRMLSHAPLSVREVNILRGICSQILVTEARSQRRAMSGT